MDVLSDRMCFCTLVLIMSDWVFDRVIGTTDAFDRVDLRDRSLSCLPFITVIGGGSGFFLARSLSDVLRTLGFSGTLGGFIGGCCCLAGFLCLGATCGNGAMRSFSNAISQAFCVDSS